MLEKINHNGELLAIIVRGTFKEPGIHFFTEDHYSQQIAYMGHPVGKQILPHVHNRVDRNVAYTQEVLFIRKGKIRVDFYSQQREYIGSKTLGSGDVILLAAGGHGFEVLEPLEMIEVKQGPYAGENDKVRFQNVEKGAVKMMPDGDWK